MHSKFESCPHHSQRTHHEYESAHKEAVLNPNMQVKKIVTKILVNQQRQHKQKHAKEQLQEESEEQRLFEKNQRSPQHGNQLEFQQTNKLTLSESEFVQYLNRYILEENLQRLYGYPTESATKKGVTEIYKHFNYLEASKLYSSGLDSEKIMKKQCIRCKRTFHITKSGEYIRADRCTFHWGKLYNANKENNSKAYTCCASGKDSAGCAHNAFHVWAGIEMGVNGPFNDFVYTRPQQPSDEPKVYALDCEMVFTGRGLEVAKVTLVNWNGQIIYDHFVQPIAAIVDYNTRFSGITERDLNRKENKKLKTLPEVQSDLLHLINADTILIGHGLENDLRVLRMVHKRIVDTSYEFPHPLGFPYRYPLKTLSKQYLKWDMQNSDMGHSSVEDSIVCMALMKWKVQEFIKFENNGRVFSYQRNQNPICTYTVIFK